MRSARQRIRDVLLVGMSLSGEMAYWPTVGETRNRGLVEDEGQENTLSSQHRRRRRRRRPGHSEAISGGDQA